MTNETPPIVVPASAVTPILTALLRQMLTFGGGYLVTKGLLSQDAANALVEQLAGAGIVLASAAWAWWKAHRTTAKMQAMADRLPDSIATTKGA